MPRGPGIRTYRPRRRVSAYRSIYGRGDYSYSKRKRRTTTRRRASAKVSTPSLVKSIVKGLAPAIGAALGGAPGAAIGSAASSLFGSLFGSGDYSVKYNTLANSGQDVVPAFANGKHRSTIIRHREYIGDVISSGTTGAFKIETYDLNPGLINTFPWLAGVANNFEEWKPHGMVWCFKTASGSVTTSQSLGTVIMATQYNVNDPTFTNKQQMENYQFGCSTVPASDLLHPIECDPKQTTFGTIYDIRDGPADGDQRLYDIGKFSIATQGIPGTNVNLGELWVTYEIELLKPQLNNFTGFLAEDLFCICNRDGTNVTSTNPLGSESDCDQFNGRSFANWSFDYTLKHAVIPAGAEKTDYMAMFAVHGSGSAPTGMADSNILLGPNVDDDLSFFGLGYQYPQLYTNTGSNMIRNFAFFHLSDNSEDTWISIDNNGSLPSNVDFSEFFIMKVPTSLNEFVTDN